MKSLRPYLFIAIASFCYTGTLAQQGMGVGNTNPQEMLDVSGAIKIGGTLQGAADAGSIRWNGTNFQGYDGTQWVNLDESGGTDSDWTISGNNQYSAVVGNVGVGTNAPSEKLDVLDGNVSVRASTASSATSKVIISGTRNGGNVSWNSAGGLGQAVLEFVNYDGGNSATFYSSSMIESVNDPGTDDGALRFLTSSDMVLSEAMRIDHTGNIGIGAKPQEKLHVVGKIRMVDGNQGANKVMTSDANGTASWVDPATLISNDGDWTVSGNNQYSVVLGNVGIGTTSPNHKLQISVNNGSGQDYPILIQNSGAINTGGTGSGIGFVTHGGSSNPKAAIYNERTANFGLGKLHFLLNNTSDYSGINLSTDSKMTILSSGNVGIGTTSPTAALHIKNDQNNQSNLVIENTDPGANSAERISFNNEDGTVAGIAVFDNDNGAYPSQMRVFNNRPNGEINLSNTSGYIRLDENGNVGIGVNNPTQNLDVAGNTTTDGLQVGTGTMFMNMQGGKTDVGASGGNNIVTINVVFPAAFASTPNVICTASAEPGTNYDDSFNVTTRNVATTGFTMVINRVDGDSWGQNLDVHWFAFQ